MPRFFLFLVVVSANPLFAEPWIVHESQYFIVETDLPARRAEHIGRLMDATGKEYDRRFAGFRGVVRRKPRVKVYAARADYLTAVQRDGPEKFVEHTAGLFDPSDEYVYAFDGPDLDRTLKHECFHQFAHFVVSGRLPPWLNEGLAEYFSEGVFDEKAGVLRLGAVPKRRIETLAQARKEGRLIPIEALLRVTNREWADAIGERGRLQYAQSWALCHLLAHADGGRYRRPFDEFLKAIDGGLDAATAFRRVFGDDLQALQQRYDKYVTELKPRSPE